MDRAKTDVFISCQRELQNLSSDRTFAVEHHNTPADSLNNL